MPDSYPQTEKEEIMTAIDDLIALIAAWPVTVPTSLIATTSSDCEKMAALIDSIQTEYNKNCPIV